MSIDGSFGERALTKDDFLSQLNRIWMPLLKKMLAAQNAAVSVGDTAPENPNIGSFWYDTTGPALKIWNGSAWAAV